MNRLWSLLFLAIPLLGTGIYLLAALGVEPFRAYWLPANFSRDGAAIDYLFGLFHIIAAVILLGTGLLLGGAIWRFGSRAAPPARYAHHNTRLEVAWTIAPAAILIFLALFQMRTWEQHKLARPTYEVGGRELPQPPLVRVVAKRFGWEFFHAGPDAQLGTPDDVYIENLLVVPSGENVVLQLESIDVIHSFFVPGLRLKQDIVPGMKHLVWFESTQPVELEILCTELCGWGHYTMQARMEVVSRSDYDAWLAAQMARNTPPLAAGGGE